MFKRIFTIIMAFTLCLGSSLLPANGLIAKEKNDTAINNEDKKKICNATEDENFAEDSVIVTVNKSNSAINKKHKISSFSKDDFSELEDLSEVEGNINQKECINKEEFQQIILLKLKKPGKKEVLKAIKKLEKLDWVESAEPNYIHQFFSEPVLISGRKVPVNRYLKTLMTGCLSEISTATPRMIS